MTKILLTTALSSRLVGGQKSGVTIGDCMAVAFAQHHLRMAPHDTSDQNRGV